MGRRMVQADEPTEFREKPSATAVTFIVAEVDAVIRALHFIEQSRRFRSVVGEVNDGSLLCPSQSLFTPLTRRVYGGVA